MINDMNLPEKGEGCRCKGKTPQTFSSSSSMKHRCGMKRSVVVIGARNLVCRSQRVGLLRMGI